MADYTIRQGDTLSGIAKRYGVDVGDLIASNPQFSNPNLIHPGETVSIPSAPVAPAAREAAVQSMFDSPLPSQLVTPQIQPKMNDVAPKLQEYSPQAIQSLRVDPSTYVYSPQNIQSLMGFRPVEQISELQRAITGYQGLPQTQAPQTLSGAVGVIGNALGGAAQTVGGVLSQQGLFPTLPGGETAASIAQGILSGGRATERVQASPTVQRFLGKDAPRQPLISTLGSGRASQQAVEAARLTGLALFGDFLGGDFYATESSKVFPRQVSQAVAEQLPFNPQSAQMRAEFEGLFGVPGFETAEEMMSVLNYIWDADKQSWIRGDDPLLSGGYGGYSYYSNRGGYGSGGGYARAGSGYGQPFGLVLWRISA